MLSKKSLSKDLAKFAYIPGGGIPPEIKYKIVKITLVNFLMPFRTRQLWNFMILLYVD